MPEPCEVCKKPAQFKCSMCKSISYCSKQHQKENWKQHKTNCLPYTVESDAKLGKRIVANRDLGKNDVIISENPLIFGPKIHIDNSKSIPCIGCYQLVPTENPPGRCLDCGWPACATHCPGLQDPKGHGTECFLLRLRSGFAVNKLEEFYRTDAITPLKCLLLQKADPKKFKTLMDMESHVQQRSKNPEYTNDIEEHIVKYLQTNFIYPLKALETKTNVELIKDYSSELIHKICGVIDTNSLEIQLSGNAELIGLYPNANLLENNCLPNTYHTFDMSPERKFRITVRASRAIRKGERITAMYTHPLWGTHARLQHLKESKFIQCECERCKDPTELGTYISALKCLNCGGLQLPLNPLDLTSEWGCNNCKVTLTSAEVEGLVAQIGMDVDQAQQTKSNVKDIQELLRKVSTFVHPNHYHVYAIKHTLVQLLGFQNGYLMNQLSDELLQEKIRLCKELLEINEKLDPDAFRLNLYTSVILHELHLARKAYAQRNIIELRLVELKEIALECLEYLRKGIEILRVETEYSPGGKLKEVLEKSRKDFDTWMKHNKIFLE